MPSSTPNRKQRVLLVESDYRTGSRLAEMLRDDGFDVDVARDGATAIAHLSRAALPDALVTTLKVRLVDGVAVARYARTQRSSLPVLVVTEHPHLLHAGVLGVGPAPVVLTKPLDYAELLSALEAQASRVDLAGASAPARS